MNWLLSRCHAFALACAFGVFTSLLMATSASAVTTTTTLYTLSGPGGGYTQPQPTSVDLYQGDTIYLQGKIDYTTPTGVTLPSPTGTIAFYDGAQLLATVAISQGTAFCPALPYGFICTGWQASFSSSALGLGVHPVTAIYGGDAQYSTSTSAVVAINVVARPIPPTSVATTTTLYTLGGPSGGWTLPQPTSVDLYQGDTVYLQGKIEYTTPSGVTLPNPAGTISFYDGAQLLGTLAISQGTTLCPVPGSLPFQCTLWQAKFSTSTLGVGAHPITAVYSGGTPFTTSTSAVVAINVVARPTPPTSVATITTLYTLGGPSGGWTGPQPASVDLYQGDPIYLQGKIEYTTPPSVTLPDPTGTISFYDGAQLLGTVAISQGMTLCPVAGSLPFQCTLWQAKFSSSTLGLGAHPITAVYGGGSPFTTSTSTVVTINVVARPVPPTTQFTGSTATSTGSAILVVSSGGPTCGFVRGDYIGLNGAAGSPSTPPPPGLVFPHGLVAFVVGGCAPGSTVNFELTLPAPLPAGTTYWKFGPTSANATPHWYAIPFTLQGSKISFSITDGATGDDDLTANGTIIDAGGPAIPEGTSTLPAESRAIPSLADELLITLALLLALCGAVARRRGLGRR